MKINRAKSIGGIVLAVLTLAIVPDSVSAQGNPSTQNGGGRLEGTWINTVTVHDCQSGRIIRTFQSLTTFISGGTMIDSTSGIPQALKTPGQGVWSHVKGNTYRISFGSFGFDAANNFTGATKITGEATLNSEGTELISAAITKIFDRNGNLIATLCPTTAAIRFE
jgi:hypothetical protein